MHMCKVEISAGSNGRTRLLIDGVDVSSWCYGFELKQNGGGIPELVVRLSRSKISSLTAQSVRLKVDLLLTAAIEGK